VKEAIKLGYRHIDCAAVYGNEKEIGEALAECIKDGVVTRDQLWITSKLWNDNHEPEHVIPALKETLTDLQLEYLDLYLVHWPVSLKHGAKGFPPSGDDLVIFDVEKTWTAMEQTVKAGLARHIGVSNFSRRKIEQLLKLSLSVKPEVNQIERHPYLQQRALVKFCQENGIHITNYSSLGSSDRPAFAKGDNEPKLLDDPIIKQIASRVGCTPASILLKWGVDQCCSVIPKSVNPIRLEENLRILDTVTLNEDDMCSIASLDQNRRYIDGAFWTVSVGSPYTMQTIWDE
jgi:alcohol dehydrogenase (NADP+)